MHKISPTKFVTLWMQGRSNEQIGRHFGIPVTAVSTYAYKLRKLGVKLPRHTANKQYESINVDRLNQLIQRKSNEA